ncbi:MAG: LysM domain [Solirubrobacteraceae bacterium]|nr:LysM domain [Solirubrobacteraceae bacterium]
MATTKPRPPLIPPAARPGEPDVAAAPPTGAGAVQPEVAATTRATARRETTSPRADRGPNGAARPTAAAGTDAAARSKAAGSDAAGPKDAPGPDPVAGPRAAAPVRARREPRGVGADGRRGRAPAAGYNHIGRARCVAVGSLLAVAAAVAMIVSTTTGGSAPKVAVAAGAPRLHARYWIVRPGQTLLSIASREQAGLADLLRLNPQLIPGSLRPGQRVRLP